MDNIIQIEMLHYVKIYGKRKLFYDLINNCAGKSGDMKPQRSPRTLFLLFVLFRNSPPKAVVLKFLKIPWKTPAVF